MEKPILLDLFSGAGGAAKGYWMAGFRVIGVDIKPQRNYPFQFIQGDAIDLLPSLLREYDIRVIHASPPCQTHSTMKAFAGKDKIDLIPLTRDRLIQTRLPYVIENVVGAPLINPVMLCGSMFNLDILKHRLFESNVKLRAPECDHAGQAARSPGYLKRRYNKGKPYWVHSPVVEVHGRGLGMGPSEMDILKRVMQIHWMTRFEMTQAIPPAYTKYLGNQLLLEVISQILKGE